MNKAFTPKRIAFYASALTQDSPRIEEGILRYHEDHPGFLFRSFRFDSEHFPESLDDLPLPWGDWIPDGIIGQINFHPPLARWIDRGGQPLVLASAEWVGHLPTVCTSSDSIADLAVGHFLALGLRNFAYIGISSPTCELRWQAFVKKLRTIGHQPLLYELENNPLGGLDQAEEKAATEIGLSRLLRTAPKPLAVFTPADMIARTVCTACRRLNLEIPGQVAVVATGNGPAARTCLPPLTSVHTPAEEVGYQAMALLEHLMLNPADRSAPCIQVPATRLVVRQSTQLVHTGENHVQRLRQLIQEQACLGTSIDQIVAQLDVSRSTLERQYMATFRCTPGQEILHVRLEKAKELLQTAQPMKTVATALGYAEASSFTKFFRKQTGMAPNEFRHGVRQSAPPDTAPSKNRKSPRR